MSDHHLAEQLRRQLQSWERGWRGPEQTPCSTGCAALDAWLPEGGFRPGSLTEWLAAGPGSGAGTLALWLAARACGSDQGLVVVDARGWFYPPALLGSWLDGGRLMLLRPRQRRDLAWGLDQALRSVAVGAVVGWLERVEERLFRRWQLAAEAGHTLGFLLRPESASREPSWADLRLRVVPLAGAVHEQTTGDARRLRLELLRCRHGAAGRRLEIELDSRTGRLHAAHSLPMAAALATGTIGPRAART